MSDSHPPEADGVSVEPLVDARHLVKTFDIGRRLVGTPRKLQAVSGVSMVIEPGETLAIVGESGSGKSTLGRMILGLMPPTSGELLYRGVPVYGSSAKRHPAFRQSVQAIFQETGSSLNPRKRVSESVGLSLRYHKGLKGIPLEERVDQLLDRVGLPHERFRHRYPHELSGGQRQRVGIARAIACEPSLIVADEPVSALDVSVQAQILNLMKGLQMEGGMSYIFISHDLGVVRNFAGRVLVMYLGIVVEQGPVQSIFESPSHPYTQALLRAIPRPAPRETGSARRKPPLGGEVPSPLDPPKGCRFHTRCPLAVEKCRVEVPPLVTFRDGAASACHFAPEVRRESRTNGLTLGGER